MSSDTIPASPPEVPGGVPGHISFWFDRLGPPPPPRPPLASSREADVCIVGAGFTGLWTAYELRRADPSLEVVVLEERRAGFGASGRNGGWVIGELAGSREAWSARRGHDATVALTRAIAGAVDEIGTVVERERIQCDFVRGGSLHVAQTPLELRRIERQVAEDRRFGLGEAESTMLGARETAARVAVENAVGSRHFAPCARVQPAALVRGLAAAVERAGATIHERTPVWDIGPGRVRAAAGDVSARFVVRATEGYTPQLRGLRRELVALNSSMIVTDPLDAATWAALGWEGAETLNDGRHRYVYLQRTADGRVAIGGRGNPYRWGSASDREGPLPARTARELRRRLGELFPSLGQTGIAAAWHGVLGVPRDWSAAVSFDPASGLAAAGGYVGTGVAAANLAGRTLRDLLLGRDTELSRLPWVVPPGRRWEPEPVRFAGIHTVYGLLVAADSRERRTGRPSLAARAAGLLAGHEF